MAKIETGGAAIRAFREAAEPRLSLGWLAGRIERAGCKRPSTAKLSRIETRQDVPVELVVALEKITGISADRLRPDLAKIFGGAR